MLARPQSLKSSRLWLSRYMLFDQTSWEPKEAFKSIGLLWLILLLPSASNAESVAKNKPQKQFYVEDIKAAMNKYVAATIDKSGDFHIRDEIKEEDLILNFDQVHDPVRQIDGGAYFACTDFHVKGEVAKIYDIDFWLQEKDGELKVFRTKIHKEPRSSLLYGWYKHPRYTFVNDEIEYLYSE
jgi:hypothetical protein